MVTAEPSNQSRIDDRHGQRRKIRSDDRRREIGGGDGWNSLCGEGGLDQREGKRKGERERRRRRGLCKAGEEREKIKRNDNKNIGDQPERHRCEGKR